MTSGVLGSPKNRGVDHHPVEIQLKEDFLPEALEDGLPAPFLGPPAEKLRDRIILPNHSRRLARTPQYDDEEETGFAIPMSGHFAMDLGVAITRRF